MYKFAIILKFFIFFYIYFIISIDLVNSNNILISGPNVCNKTVHVTEMLARIINVTYKSFEYVDCPAIPVPSCINNITSIKTLVDYVSYIKLSHILSCCENYTENEKKDRCVPLCIDKCIYGECVEPNNCHCDRGYKGHLCNESCETNKWGSGCLNDCTCQNYAFCSPYGGECFCTAGWKGKNCSKSCDSTEYGPNCVNKCLCQNEVICNKINGFCTCAPGWEGEFCERPCKKWYYGDCSTQCKCNKINSFMCDSEGFCDCKEGWKGPRCESKCSTGFFGKNCEGRCTCMNNATCNIQNGECDCTSGFVGRNCEIPFQPNVLDVCSKGSYGQSCQEKCLIISKTTYKDNFYYCEPNTGSIMCKAGYIGLKCEETCPTGLYGYNCRLKCNCSESHSCAPDTGKCLMEQTHLTTFNIIVIVLLALMLAISLPLVFYLYCFCARYKKMKKMLARPQSWREKFKIMQKDTSETVNVINFNIASNKNQNISNNEAYEVHEVENLEHVYHEITDTNENTYDHLNYMQPRTSIKSHYQNFELHTFN